MHSVHVHGDAGLKGRVVVHFEGDAYLRLQPAVLEAPDESGPPPTKLTVEAACELLACARQFRILRRKAVAR